MGKVFEKNFKDSVDENMYYFRIKDPANSFGQDSSLTRFSLPNPFDCFIYLYPYFFAFELKDTQNGSLSIQKEKEDKGKMIKLVQIKGLSAIKNFKGANAGFVINFRDNENVHNDETFFLHINDFNRFLKDSNKKSINKKDVITYGGIAIDKTLKKVNYKYNIKEALNAIIDRHLNE